jgi:hypothetical protein
MQKIHPGNSQSAANYRSIPHVIIAAICFQGSEFNNSLSTLI